MKDRKVPLRKCVGCQQSTEKKNLVRIAGFEGKMTVDFSGRAPGRGAYLCKGSADCLEKAFKKKALERALRIPLDPEDKERLMQELKGGEENV